MSLNNGNSHPIRKAPPINNPYARKRLRPNPSGNSTNTTIHTQPPVSLQTSYQQPQQHHGPTIGASVYGSKPSTRPSTSRGRSNAASNAVTGSSTTVDRTAPQSTSQPSSVPLAPDFSQPQTTNQQVKKVKRDSFDDDNIDWDAFIQVADKTETQVTAGTSNSNNYYNSNKHNHSDNEVLVVKVSTPAKNDNPNNKQGNIPIDSPVIDLTQPDAQTIPGAACMRITCHQKNNTTMSYNQSAMEAAKKPPPLAAHKDNNSKPPRPLGRNDMASLRPPSWSSSSSSTATATGATTQNNVKTSTPGKPPLSQQMVTQQGKLCSPGASNLDPLMVSLPRELRFNREKVMQPVKDSNLQNLVKHANLSAPLANGWTLFSHQKKAILRGLQMRRFILALDMGLGKTLIGCVWAKSFQRTFENLKVIIICPASLKDEWTRTAEEATSLQVEKEASKSKKKSKKQNTTDGDKQEDSIYPKVQIHSWAKVPTNVDETYDNYVVICDEAHSIQSMTAVRTKDLLKLVKPQRCVGVLLLTGTPMKNGKPSNLFPLLKAVRHPLGSHQKSYEVHFCAGREIQFGRGPKVWDAKGSSNLEHLRELVSSHLLHLTKDECLKDLPPARREHKHVPVSNRLDSEHNRALKNLARIFAAPSTPEKNDAVLGAFTTLRTVGAMAKIDATVDLAKKILEEEPAIVIFTSFVKVAKTVHSKLASAGWAGALLTGETATKDRQQLVDNFQEGISPVFVCTFGAGGVGLTLTAARTIILIDRPWTPGDTHQAEDRIRRIGQAHAVRSIWMTAFDVDKSIDAMIEQKTQATNTVLTKGQNDSQPKSLSAPAPKISIFNLVKTLLRENDVLNTAATSNGPSLSQTSMHSHVQQLR